jgi:hypothetical protein
MKVVVHANYVLQPFLTVWNVEAPVPVQVVQQTMLSSTQMNAIYVLIMKY